jgi:ergothioneine biosynthesis protein EgtB
MVMQVTAGREADALLGGDGLRRTYERVRAFTLEIVRPLTDEDCVAQSMPDASPAKWHLAHTTWFFEAFVLAQAIPGYRAVYPDYLFNSYYDALGTRHCRARRGLLTRPSLAEVRTYRERIDALVLGLLAESEGPLTPEIASVITLGCHHEQQHQELILTDVKHLFSENPLRPAYRPPARGAAALPREPGPVSWLDFGGELSSIGHAGHGFAFDNEGPRHRVFVEDFSIASRLVTNGEYAAFIADGGYERPEFWLSDGYKALTVAGWRAPLYWEGDRTEGYRVLTLEGMRPLALAEPVCHVSYYEADAYARWAGARLLTEAEWEIATERADPRGNFVETGLLHPRALREPTDAARVQQMFGDTWEWTSSAYAPYPGFRPLTGALGEYNGKFMCNQMVLRGGSCATSETHMRRTYRNFFPPDARWQFAGIRLARS